MEWFRRQYGIITDGVATPLFYNLNPSSSCLIEYNNLRDMNPLLFIEVGAILVDFHVCRLNRVILV
jgi:hypothetical protein